MQRWDPRNSCFVRSTDGISLDARWVLFRTPRSGSTPYWKLGKLSRRRKGDGHHPVAPDLSGCRQTTGGLGVTSPCRAQRVDHGAAVVFDDRALSVWMSVHIRATEGRQWRTNDYVYGPLVMGGAAPVEQFSVPTSSNRLFGFQWRAPVLSQGNPG